MIKRTTWYFLAGFVVLLLAAFFIVQDRENFENGEIMPTPSVEFLIEQNDKTITMISVEDEYGNFIGLKQNDGNEWIFEPALDSNVDIVALESLISQFQQSRIISRIDYPPAAEDFGLDNPGYILQVGIGSEAPLTFLVGNQTPTGSGYYVVLGNEELLVVDKFGIETVIGLVDNPPVSNNQTEIPEANNTSEP